MNESGRGQMNNRDGLENYGLKKQQILFGFIPIIPSFLSSFLIFVFSFFLFKLFNLHLSHLLISYEVC